MVASTYAQALDAHIATFESIRGLDVVLQQAVTLIAQSMQSGGKLMICGNGGSAADAQHIAAEFIGRFVNDRAPLPSIALTTDSSALTCVANDYSFDAVFTRQVLGLGKKEDILLGISTSGNSGNVIEAIKAAQNLGIKTIGLLGRDGGQIAPMVDLAITVPSHTTARIQEAHIFLGHMICAGVEQTLGVAG